MSHLHRKREVISWDSDDLPPLEVDHVVFVGPAIWVAVTPDHWSLICRLATRYGWLLPRSESKLTSEFEWTFAVRDESALELSKVLERIRGDYTDRELFEQFFGQCGWKQKLGSLASFFAGGGAAVFV
jgi:hypothetical protein